MMTKKINARKSLVQIFLYAASILLLLWAIGPILWIFISSISNRIELYSVPFKHWIPQQPTLQNYIDLITSGIKYRGSTALPARELLFSGLRNSLVMSLGTALIITFLSLLGGYVFGRLNFRGKSLIFALLMALVALPIWVSLISLYFIMSRLHLIDNVFGMILLFVAYGLPLYVWLMQTYLETVPQELEDAALIDGATRIRALFSVILPVVSPGLTSVFLVSFLTTWNSFLIPIIFSNTQKSSPLTVVMSLFIGQYEVVWESMAAASILIIIPPLLLALIFQRYLVRGLSIGAVK